MDLRDVQTELKEMALYTADVDGDFGPRTDDAIEAFLASQRIKDFEKWGNSRQLAAAQQAVARLRGIEVGAVDGLIGTLSKQAFAVYDARKKVGWKVVPEIELWRDDPANTPTVTPTRVVTPARGAPPVPGGSWGKQSRIQSKFGAPGVSKNQVTLTLPYSMRLAWDLGQTVRTTSCHLLVREHIEYVFWSVKSHYGLEEIRRLRLDLFGGLLNVRKMRGGSSWSTHAYGVAVDVDPERNALKMTRRQATLDDPAYDPFWSFVAAIKATSLGRKHDYDWMHFQCVDT